MRPILVAGREKKRRGLATTPLRLAAAALALVAHQHRDAVILVEGLVAVAAGADPGPGHARVRERFDDAVHAPCVRSVDGDPERRILPHVFGDLPCLVAVGADDVVAASFECEVAIERPMDVALRARERALLTDRSRGSLRAGRTGGSRRTAEAGQLRIARGAGKARGALRARMPCGTRGARRAFGRESFGARASGHTPEPGGAGSTRGAGRTCDARALRAHVPGRALRTRAARGTRFTRAPHDHLSPGACFTRGALHAGGAGRSGCAGRADHRDAR